MVGWSAPLPERMGPPRAFRPRRGDSSLAQGGRQGLTCRRSEELASGPRPARPSPGVGALPFRGGGRSAEPLTRTLPAGSSRSDNARPGQAGRTRTEPMTLSAGWHGTAVGLRRGVAGGCVAAGIAAGIWAGPAAFASSSVSRSGSSVSPAPTKYYIVPVPAQGGTETLYNIALRTLGNGARYREIFNLNK